MIAFAGAAAAAIVVLHRPNIRRLLAGHREPRDVPAAPLYCSSGAIVRPRRLSPFQ